MQRQWKIKGDITGEYIEEEILKFILYFMLLERNIFEVTPV